MGIARDLLIAGAIVSVASLCLRACNITNWMVRAGMIVGPLLLLASTIVAIATGQA